MRDHLYFSCSDLYTSCHQRAGKPSTYIFLSFLILLRGELLRLSKRHNGSVVASSSDTCVGLDVHDERSHLNWMYYQIGITYTLSQTLLERYAPAIWSGLPGEYDHIASECCRIENPFLDISDDAKIL